MNNIEQDYCTSSTNEELTEEALASVHGGLLPFPCSSCGLGYYGGGYGYGEGMASNYGAGYGSGGLLGLGIGNVIGIGNVDLL
ncbi:hypothetical protein [Dictyobacter aurantiacus]|uniref:Bacteriocin n=1 Tax=Dictyobacter aurantiacus TaxID=1936993 RepID=A0A401ZFT3_9CHLR|nr:hypothetical protein [Dictyobacter aurantiacus]GCE05744.1 hypothetical protein KDAU_30730 [Dictyobacter aurantiacus]